MFENDRQVSKEFNSEVEEFIISHDVSLEKKLILANIAIDSLIALGQFTDAEEVFASILSEIES
jgi:hypothetical protein